MADNFHLSITAEAYEAMMDTIGRFPAETGGVLGGDRKAGRITEFYFDEFADRSAITYSPAFRHLNEILLKRWNAVGIDMMGFVHSHPNSLTVPSGGDRSYAKRILAANLKMAFLFAPIIIPAQGLTPAKIFPYAIDREGNVHTVTLRIDGARHSHAHADRLAPRPELEPPATPVPGAIPTILGAAKRAYQSVKPAASGPAVTAQPVHLAQPRFHRVERAYDLPLLAESRLIVIGGGGSRAYVEEMARAGEADFVLLDPDVVEAPNIGTQQVYADEIGKPKVEALAAALRRIDPSIGVDARQVSLDDLDDAAFEALLHKPLATTGRPPRRERILLAGCTDHFPAQARVNRLGLQYGIATLSAQVYQEGRGAEITFTAPGYTPACHRCALAGRYKAVADGYQNSVGSFATPIFATARLNALKGMLSLALLHRGTDHPRWGGLLERIGNRNLVQMRLDPDIATTIGLPIFDTVLEGADRRRLLFDDTVWMPQDADHPHRNGYPTCPDCHGTGNLADSIGRFHDTRPMEGGRDHPPAPTPDPLHPATLTT